MNIIMYGYGEGGMYQRLLIVNERYYDPNKNKVDGPYMSSPYNKRDLTLKVIKV